MTGFTPVPRVVFQSCTAPAMEPWSVRLTAGISSSAARATRSGMRHAPSRIEYSEWTCRWTKSASAMPERDRVRPPQDRTAPALCGILAAVFTGIPEGEGHDPGEFYAAAIYGSILAVAFITIFRQEHAAPQAVAVSVLGTMVVFFIAHVWSSVLGWRLHHRERVTFTRVQRIARGEWPLLEAGAVP